MPILEQRDLDLIEMSRRVASTRKAQGFGLHQAVLFTMLSAGNISAVTGEDIHDVAIACALKGILKAYELDEIEP